MSSLGKDMHQERLLCQAVEHNRELIESLFKHVGELESYLQTGWQVSTDTIEAEHQTWKTVKWEAVVDSTAPASLEYIELLKEHVSLGNSIQQIKDRIKLKQDVAKGGKWIKGKSRPVLDIAREGESTRLVGGAGSRWAGKQYGIKQPASAPPKSASSTASKEPPLREFFQGSAIFGPNGILAAGAAMAGQNSMDDWPVETDSWPRAGESSRANEFPRPNAALKPGLTFQNRGTMADDEGPPPKSAAASKDNEQNARKSVFSSMHYVHIRDTARASKASEANRAFGTFGSFRAVGAPRINEDPLASVSARADDVYMGRTARRHEEMLGFSGTVRDEDTPRADDAPRLNEIPRSNMIPGPSGACGFGHMYGSGMATFPYQVAEASRAHQLFESNTAPMPNLGPNLNMASRAGQTRPTATPKPRVAPKMYQSCRTGTRFKSSHAGPEQHLKMGETPERKWHFRPSMYSEAGHVLDYPMLDQRFRPHETPQPTEPSRTGASVGQHSKAFDMATEAMPPRESLRNRGVSVGQPFRPGEVIDLTMDIDEPLHSERPMSSGSPMSRDEAPRAMETSVPGGNREMDVAAVQEYMARRARERAAEDRAMGRGMYDSDDEEDCIMDETRDHNPGTWMNRAMRYDRRSPADQANPFIQAMRQSELEASARRQSVLDAPARRQSEINAPNPHASVERPSVFSPPPRQNPFARPGQFLSPRQDHGRQPSEQRELNPFAPLNQPTEFRQQQQDSPIQIETEPSQDVTHNYSQETAHHSQETTHHSQETTQPSPADMAQIDQEMVMTQQFEPWMQDDNPAQWLAYDGGFSPWPSGQLGTTSGATPAPEQVSFDPFLAEQADWAPGMEWISEEYWMERPGSS